MSLSILHLTDIHAGPGEVVDQDTKQVIPDVQRLKMLERLTNYLVSLPDKPDFVAITGDFTNRANDEGFQIVKKWLEERIAEGTLPSQDHILVLPGNHDVKWKVEESKGWHKERYMGFFDAFCKEYPHAYIPDCDPPLKFDDSIFDGMAVTFFGGIRTAAKSGQLVVEQSLPFILDLKKDIFIYAFNSSLSCGVYLSPSANIKNPLDALLAYHNQEDIKSKLTEISKAYKDSLLVDAGYVGDTQLAYFSQVNRALQQKIGSRYSKLTKIALLHHHVSHLWQQQLEVKNFETVIDAAQFKQRLVEFGFDMVFHGHKHTNHVALDASIIPLNSPRKLDPFCVSSGGTICGYPRLQDRQTFKLIKLEEDRGPRTKATITEVPLLDTEPSYTIAHDSKVYSVPLSSRLPTLHDLKDLKHKADELVCKFIAKELSSQYNGLVLSSSDMELPSANPGIVGNGLSYKWYRVLESTEERVFYDIILATKDLGFKQKARIYWMLTDVNNLVHSLGKASKVILLIGNLEGTHFFEGKEKDEIEASIKSVKQFFAPAIGSGLFEVRSHNFTQDEVDGLVEQMSK